MAIDYTILVNRDHPIPEDHSDRIPLVRLHSEDDFFILVETLEEYTEMRRCL